MSPPGRLSYSFVPLPRSATRALRERRLSHADIAILVALYALEPFGVRSERRPVRVTLDGLAAACAWPHTVNYMSKRLAALRAAGWISFESVPGRRRPVYEIQLLRPESEDAEELNLAREAGSPVPSLPAGPSWKPVRAESEHDAAQEAVLRGALDGPGPSTGGSGPSSNPPAIPHGEQAEGPPGPDRSPSSIDLPQTTPRDDEEGSTPGDDPALARDDEIAWPDVVGLSREAASTANADALVAQAGAYWPTGAELHHVHRGWEASTLPDELLDEARQRILVTAEAEETTA